MFESILFMILMFVGIISLIVSVFIIIFGFIKKERQLKNIGYIIGAIPIFCFGLIAFWYGVAIPSFNKRQQSDFSGIYEPHKSSQSILEENKLLGKTYQLTLRENGTYLFDSLPGIRLSKKGKWKTGGIDGAFIFYDNEGKIADFISQSGSGNDCGLTIPFQTNEDIFFNTESIYFEKIKEQ